MNRTELVHAPLHLMILKTLTWGRQHGYGIARWIREVSGDVLQVEEGSLYPALHRLEQWGWIEAEWGLSENNRRAKYYQLTLEGSRHLRSESPHWQRFAAAVGQVLSAAEGPA